MTINNYKLLKTFINSLSYFGNKIQNEKIVISILFELKQEFGHDPYSISYDILNAVKPIVGLRAKRIGGVVYQLPYQSNEHKQYRSSIKLIINSARKRSEHTFKDKLKNELKDIYYLQSMTIAKRIDIHTIALSNRAFLK